MKRKYQVIINNDVYECKNKKEVKNIINFLSPFTHKVLKNDKIVKSLTSKSILDAINNYNCFE